MLVMPRSILVEWFLLFLAATTSDQYGHSLLRSCQAFGVLPPPINIRTHSSLSLLTPPWMSSTECGLVLRAAADDDDENEGDEVDGVDEEEEELEEEEEDDTEWKGEVVSNTPDGYIQGCSLEPVAGSLTEWTINIDGVQADLGRFSEVVYKKVMSDAKRERFKGFRPGTVPPVLEPNYRAFSMDECARETVLEAMQQNNLRPFENARMEMMIENVSIPPPTPSNKKKKKSKKNSKSKNADVTDPQDEAQELVVEETTTTTTTTTAGEQQQWLTFATVQEAVVAGWRPGQSFSFVATNVKGQKVKEESETKDAQPLGLKLF